MKINFCGYDIHVHSEIDVITNSSSVTYIIPSADAIPRIKSFFEQIMKACGSDKKFDDVFEISIELSKTLIKRTVDSYCGFDEDDLFAQALLQTFPESSPYDFMDSPLAEKSSKLIERLETIFKDMPIEELLKRFHSDTMEEFYGYMLGQCKLNIKTKSKDFCDLIEVMSKILVPEEWYWSP